MNREADPRDLDWRALTAERWRGFKREWNELRIQVQEGRVEHWLNGRRVVEYRLGSPEWRERVGRSKFAGLAHYGRAPRGHLALQDHGDWVAYRNIRVRVPPRSPPE